MKYVQYVEPTDESCQDFRVVNKTIPEAIAHQQLAGMQRNHFYGDPQSALDDFLVCNWAKIVDLEPQIEAENTGWQVVSPWLMQIRWPKCKRSDFSYASSHWVCPSDSWRWPH